jgi:hypothetical protein
MRMQSEDILVSVQCITCLATLAERKESHAVLYQVQIRIIHQTERILTCLPQNLRNYSAYVASWFFVRWHDRFYCKQRKKRNENGSKLNVLIITKLVIFYYMKLIQLVVFREMHLWRLICMCI